MFVLKSNQELEPGTRTIFINVTVSYSDIKAFRYMYKEAIE